jgi:hypothetical protein
MPFPATAKRAIRRRFPSLTSAYSKLRGTLLGLHWRFVKRPQLRRMSLEAVFSWYYDRPVWGRGAESISGGGSTTAATETIRSALPKLISDFGVRTMLDIPCGDGNWMSQVPLNLDLYIGADIVQQLVDFNLRRWGETERRKFAKLDLTRDGLPRVDLIFCRDCLVHLSDANVIRGLANIKASGSTYLISTTFPNHPENADIVDGEWRPINLERQPFNLPPPLRLVCEGLTESSCSDKSLGLWRIDELH